MLLCLCLLIIVHPMSDLTKANTTKITINKKEYFVPNNILTNIPIFESVIIGDIEGDIVIDVDVDNDDNIETFIDSLSNGKTKKYCFDEDFYTILDFCKLAKYLCLEHFNFQIDVISDYHTNGSYIEYVNTICSRKKIDDVTPFIGTIIKPFIITQFIGTENNYILPYNKCIQLNTLFWKCIYMSVNFRSIHMIFSSLLNKGLIDKQCRIILCTTESWGPGVEYNNLFNNLIKNISCIVSMFNKVDNEILPYVISNFCINKEIMRVVLYDGDTRLRDSYEFRFDCFMKALGLYNTIDIGLTFPLNDQKSHSEIIKLLSFKLYEKHKNGNHDNVIHNIGNFNCHPNITISIYV